MIASKNYDITNYEDLYYVLMRALEQAKFGKGRDRHGKDLPFKEQRLFKILGEVGPGFAAGQAVKKILESVQEWEKGDNVSFDKIECDLEGALVYTAALLIWMNYTEHPTSVE